MRNHKLMTFLLTLALVALLPVAAFAGGGDGSGGGGGSSVALAFRASEPAEGSENVSLTPEISLEFTHNVTVGSLSEDNLALLSMATADGQPVEIETWTGDAQIDPDLRRLLYLKPVEPLSEGTTYVVTAAAGIQAKNGMVTEEDQTLTFTTEGVVEESSSAGNVVLIIAVAVVAAAVIVGFSRKAKKKQ